MTTTSAARLAPMRFLAVVEDGLCRAVGGDVGYAGLIAKNPLHKDWQVIERHGHLYTLDELAAGLDLTPANARNWTPANIEEAYGVGRNVGLFTETRFWAYSAIREYWAPNGLPRWQEAVLGHVEALNRRLRAPLPYTNGPTPADDGGGAGRRPCRYGRAAPNMDNLARRRRAPRRV